MPGLPRADTKKRFNKLLKASGKSKTNTAAGATAVTKNISTKETMIIKFADFINEGKLSPIEDYFDEITRLFREYKDLNVKEAKQVVQEYSDYITKEYEKGTPVKKTYKDLTYLVGDI